jgi:hypothetical protein
MNKTLKCRPSANSNVHLEFEGEVSPPHGSFHCPLQPVGKKTKKIMGWEILDINGAF